MFKSTWTVYFANINDKGEIPGVYSTDGSNWLNFIIRPPYRHLKARRGHSVVTAMSNNGVLVGYALNPNKQPGIWGLVKQGGIWTLVEDPNEGGGGNAVTELLGVNDEDTAVGFYTNGSGINIATVLDVTTLTFLNIHHPGAGNSSATGVNDKGDIVGSMNGSTGPSGFLLVHGAFTKLQYPGREPTYPTAINIHDEIVGYYFDASGTSHGFLLTDPVKDPRWRSFDEPHGARDTVLTGINDRGDLAGWYVDQAGAQKPFICL